MALAANIYFDRVPFLGRSGFERSAARAYYRRFVIIGMYIGFHAFTSLYLLSYTKMLIYYILFFHASQINSYRFPKIFFFFRSPLCTFLFCSCLCFLHACRPIHSPPLYASFCLFRFFRCDSLAKSNALHYNTLHGIVRIFSVKEKEYYEDLENSFSQSPDDGRKA